MNIEKLRKKCQIDKDKSPYKAISIYITALLLKLGISANQTMILEVLVVLLGGIIIFVIPLSYYWIIAGLLFYLGDILDKANGEIARYWEISSPKGAFLDGLIDTLRLGLVITFVSYGMYKTLGNIFDLILGYLAIFSLFIYNFSEKSVFLIFNKNKRIANFGAYDDPGTRNVKGIKKVGLLIATAFTRSTTLLICISIDVLLFKFISIRFITLWLFAYSSVFLSGAAVRTYECKNYVDKLR
jgi:hypothetical protein